MMKSAFLALAAVCLVGQVLCRPSDDEATADPTYLKKQMKLYQLFFHADQPNHYFEELYEIARNFELEKNVNNYYDKEAVNAIIKYKQNGLLVPRGEVFSLLDPKDAHQAVMLYRLLVSANSYDMFYTTAVYTRFYMNEQMHTYALTVAMIQRPDTKFIKVPPLYEVMPHLFFNEDVMHEAYTIAMGDTSGANQPTSGKPTYIIQANYSGRYVPRDSVDEQAVNYFTEDIGLNHFYFMINQHFPHYVSAVEASLQPKIRGEYYFFIHKQLLARHYLERLCNGLGAVQPASVDRAIEVGYYPTMHHPNGLRFPHRDSNSALPVEVETHTQRIKDLHSRIANAIDNGYVIDKEGKQINIYTENGLNILGNIVQGNADTINAQTYGHIDLLARKVFGFSLKTDNRYHLIPSALELYSTSLRDPIFFSIYKTILGYYHRYKENLPKYTVEDLLFPGVRIESVNVDKLTTYFDTFDSMLNNGVSIRNQNDADSSITKARQHRLNHKPFTYHMSIRSDKNTKAVIRIFLGPKHDEFGNEFALKDNFMNFVELDQFVVDLKIGGNSIKRLSQNSMYTVGDEMPSDVLYKKVVESMNGNGAFTYFKHPYGYPDRLILPKGTPEGMEYKLFVVVSHFDETKAVVIDSPVWGNLVFDGRPMGFPLDRPANPLEFTPYNLLFKDVVIYHKDTQHN